MSFLQPRDPVVDSDSLRIHSGQPSDRSFGRTLGRPEASEEIAAMREEPGFLHKKTWTWTVSSGISTRKDRLARGVWALEPSSNETRWLELIFVASCRTSSARKAFGTRTGLNAFWAVWVLTVLPSCGSTPKPGLGLSGMDEDAAGGMSAGHQRAGSARRGTGGSPGRGTGGHGVHGWGAFFVRLPDPVASLGE